MRRAGVGIPAANTNRNGGLLMPLTAPQMDFKAAKAICDNIHDVLDSLMKQWGVPDWFRPYVAGSVAGITFCISFIVLMVLQVVMGLGAWAGASFLEVLGVAKKENADGINDLIAETANEMLGTDLTGKDLTSGSGGGSSMDQNKIVGDALIKIFEQGLGGLQPVSPEQGAENARKFAGFSINFAISQGFLSILSEAASIGFLKEFHELPDGLQHALGLGRLQRAALAPLIRNCISQPYDLYLKALIRPDRLSEGQIVTANRAGKLSDQDARQALAEKGYRDQDIDLLIADLTQKLSASELFTLVRFGDLSMDQAIQKLTDQGWDKETAALQLKVLSRSREDSHVSSILTDLEADYVNGFVDQVTYNSILGKLPLSDDEQQMYRQRVGLQQEVPSKRVTFAQLTKGVVERIVDFSAVDDWLKNEGYGPADQDILTFEILGSLKDAADKDRFKKYKADQLRVKGKPVPPWLE